MRFYSSTAQEDRIRSYRKSSIKPPGGAHFFEALFRGGFIERGGGFKLAKVDIYRLSNSSSQDQELVGHLPIELSFLLCKVLSREVCSLEFSPTGARFLE